MKSRPLPDSAISFCISNFNFSFSSKADICEKTCRVSLLRRCPKNQIARHSGVGAKANFLFFVFWASHIHRHPNRAHKDQCLLFLSTGSDRSNNLLHVNFESECRSFDLLLFKYLVFLVAHCLSVCTSTAATTGRGSHFEKLVPFWLSAMFPQIDFVVPSHFATRTSTKAKRVPFFNERSTNGGANQKG